MQNRAVLSVFDESDGTPLNDKNDAYRFYNKCLQNHSAPFHVLPPDNMSFTSILILLGRTFRQEICYTHIKVSTKIIYSLSCQRVIGLFSLIKRVIR